MHCKTGVVSSHFLSFSNFYSGVSLDPSCCSRKLEFSLTSMLLQPLTWEECLWVCLSTLGGEQSTPWPPRTKVGSLSSWSRCVMCSSRYTEATNGLSYTGCRKHRRWPQLLSLGLPMIYVWKQKKTLVKAGGWGWAHQETLAELKLQARWRVEEGSKATSYKLAELWPLAKPNQQTALPARDPDSRGRAS